LIDDPSESILLASKARAHPYFAASRSPRRGQVGRTTQIRHRRGSFI
jgi:hypothetical protein